MYFFRLPQSRQNGMREKFDQKQAARALAKQTATSGRDPDDDTMTTQEPQAAAVSSAVPAEPEGPGGG